jgi:hypothetical protein
MKKVIQGVTYNIDTSTPVACSRREEDGREVDRMLFQTQGGAFFIRKITTWAVKRFDVYSGEYHWDERQKDEFLPLTSEEAEQWIMEGEVEILSDIFPDPLEARPESTVSATIHLRVPAVLKKRIEAAANKAGQSINVWAMRCLETGTQTSPFPDDEFDVDLVDRKVTHHPSEICFSFYEYRNERDWLSAAPAHYRENPEWEGNRFDLGLAAKRAAVAAGMKHSGPASRKRVA